MPKIPGLKKKKKGKKNKHKTEEEFDAEELEKYRKEHEQREQASNSSEQGQNSAEKSDEWQKFKALTAGVDSILKKTQDDLERIKETSYFQRKPPGPSEYGRETSKVDPKETWTDFEEGQEGEETTKPPEVPVLSAKELEELKFKEFDESEYEEDSDEEDLFDTAFLDLVATEDLPLAVIPDSPIDQDDGPDPFDTSIVDKVIKPESEQEKKRKLITLGCAVEVLAGKAVSPTPVIQENKCATPRRRPKPVDLLLGSFDENSPRAQELENSAAVLETPVKTLLDEEVDVELPLTPVDVVDTISILQKINESVQEAKLPSYIKKKTSPDLEELGLTEIDENDEFSALATESLSKKPLKSEPIKPQRPPPPKDFNTEEKFNLEDPDDPFDTSFAEVVLPGECELKFIEKEILEADPSQLITGERVKFDGKTIKYSGVTIEINNHPQLNKTQDLSPEVQKPDLLGGSTTDLSLIGSTPIEPTPIITTEENFFSSDDPFDTSVVHTLTAPGEAELKILEQELLAETKVKDDSKALNRPDQLLVSGKSSIPKVVAFIEPPGINGAEESSKKPVTPYYPGRSFESETTDFLTAEEDLNVKLQTPVTPKKVENELENIDPFDTCIASNIIQPSSTELKIIESELMNNSASSESLDLK